MAAECMSAEKKETYAFFMKTEDIYYMAGGICAVGTVAQGEIRVGQPIVIRTPAGVEFSAKVGGIQRGQDQLLSSAAAGESILSVMVIIFTPR